MNYPTSLNKSSGSYDLMNYSLSIHEPSFLNTKTTNPVSERFIHKLWELGALTKKPLLCLNGQKIEVLSLGELNKTDGPDILHAVIKSNGIEYHGSIEFHIQEQDWFSHKHHEDRKYENVIAHVFLVKGKKRAFSGQNEPLFHIELDESSIDSAVIEQLKQRSYIAIPCGDMATKAHPTTWQKQLEHADHIYFASLTKRFNANKNLLKFKESICAQIWEQLGVPHNRTQMIDAFTNWLNVSYNLKDLNNHSKSVMNVDANSKAVRPNQRLNKIVEKAIALSEVILSESFAFNNWDNEDLNRLSQLCKKEKISLSKDTVNRLNKFVWYPAIAAYYQEKSRFQGTIFDEWQRIPTPITSKHRTYYQGIHFFKESLLIRTSPVAAAMIAQQRFFCEAKQCNECFLFKIHFSY
jgi:hypothetical protein